VPKLNTRLSSALCSSSFIWLEDLTAVAGNLDIPALGYRDSRKSNVDWASVGSAPATRFGIVGKKDLFRPGSIVPADNKAKLVVAWPGAISAKSVAVLALPTNRPSPPPPRNLHSTGALRSWIFSRRRTRGQAAPIIQSPYQSTTAAFGIESSGCAGWMKINPRISVER